VPHLVKFKKLIGIARESKRNEEEKCVEGILNDFVADINKLHY
jgi:hypothetical protein